MFRYIGVEGNISYHSHLPRNESHYFKKNLTTFKKNFPNVFGFFLTPPNAQHPHADTLQPSHDSPQLGQTLPTFPRLAPLPPNKDNFKHFERVQRLKVAPARHPATPNKTPPKYDPLIVYLSSENEHFISVK